MKEMNPRYKNVDSLVLVQMTLMNQHMYKWVICCVYQYMIGQLWLCFDPECYSLNQEYTPNPHALIG